MSLNIHFQSVLTSERLMYWSKRVREEVEKSSTDEEVEVPKSVSGHASVSDHPAGVEKLPHCYQQLQGEV